MTHLTNISEEASLVLVSELITALETQRKADGQPSLVAQLKAAIAQAFIDTPEAAPGLRIGMADAQLVLEEVEQTLDTPRDRDLHFGDLVAGLPGVGPYKKSLVQGRLAPHRLDPGPARLAG
jgi:hypothetical protein